MAYNFVTDGLPISNKRKFTFVLGFLLLTVFNHIMVSFFPSFEYAYRGYVSFALLLLVVIFSIGSVVTETFIIALTFVAIVSNIWDFGVFDVSLWRKKLLIGSFLLMFIILTFGKVGIVNLTGNIKSQLGLK